MTAKDVAQSKPSGNSSQSRKSSTSQNPSAGLFDPSVSAYVPQQAPSKGLYVPPIPIHAYVDRVTHEAYHHGLAHSYARGSYDGYARGSQEGFVRGSREGFAQGF
jgi:hypothetical protein